MRYLLLTCFSLLLPFSATVTAVFANPAIEAKYFDLGTQLRAIGGANGLGNEDAIDVKLDAEGLATVECVNRNGRVMATQLIPVTVSGFAPGVTFDHEEVEYPFIVITAAPPDPNPPEVCRNSKWSTRITDIEFTSATLTAFQPAGSGIVVAQSTSFGPFPF